MPSERVSEASESVGLLHGPDHSDRPQESTSYSEWRVNVSKIFFFKGHNRELREKVNI